MQEVRFVILDLSFRLAMETYKKTKLNRFQIKKLVDRQNFAFRIKSVCI